MDGTNGRDIMHILTRMAVIVVAAMPIASEALAARKQTRSLSAERLPVAHVLVQLSSRGYSDFSAPVLIGRTYRIAATNVRGLRKAVIVDAYTGVVVHRRKMAPAEHDIGIPPSGGR